MVGYLSALLLALWAAPQAPPKEGYCIHCHAAEKDARLRVPTASVAASVHGSLDAPCVACHGGDVREPTLRAHDPSRGFRGVPKPQDVPSVCGGCHADAAFIRPYSAALSVDQLSLYRTSEHGRHLAQGETEVATCVRCHGSHGVRRVSDRASPVHALNVASTCGHCHGDENHAARRGGKKDPLSAYRKSVHAKALYEQGDVSAPTCNDCHGDHGASPPGVRSIHRACGGCHAEQSELFQQSPHDEAFARLGFGECDECHGNHAVLPTSDEMLSSGEGGVCRRCHSAGTKGAEMAARLYAILSDAKEKGDRAHEMLERAEARGLSLPEAEVAERELFTAARRLRIAVHRIDTSSLAPELEAIDTPLAKIEQAVNEGESALKTKRRGYLVFTALCALMIMLLSLKLRRLAA
jgi:predicted CXXCH cytochrome family protein